MDTPFSSSVEWLRDQVSATAATQVPWNWTAALLVCLAAQFPTGVTASIVLADAESAWLRASAAPKKFAAVPNTTAISEAQVSPNSLFELRIVALKGPALVCGNPITKLSDGDDGSTAAKFTIDVILHSKFKFIVDGSFASDILNPNSGINALRFTSAILTKRTPSIHPRFLPTQHMVFLLSPNSPLLSTHFTHSLSHITPQSLPTTLFQLVLKVTSISPPTASSTTTLPRRIIRLRDLKSTRTVHLVLYGDSIKIADLVEPNELIAIYNPFVHPACFEGTHLKELEYGDWTVLFVVSGGDSLKNDENMEPSSKSQSIQVSRSKSSLPIDENGRYDFKWYPNRFTFSDFRPNQKNVCILGTIVHMTNNMPIQKEGRKSDRFGIRLMDEHGATIDLTLWDQVGLSNRRLLLGQTVYVQNVSTAWKEKKDSAGGGSVANCFVVGNEEYGTSVFCLSTSLGLLSSPVLRKLITLKEGTQVLNAGFSARVTVTGFSVPASGYLTEYIHQPCARPLETQESILYCRFCSLFPPIKGVHSLNVIFHITDASGVQMEVLARGRVADEMLGVSGPEFNAIVSGERRVQVLERVIGWSGLVWVSVYKERKTDRIVRRIDAVIKD
ncbi:hypothetical protein BCR33DRAFT_769744 [Rhizoclosmatium globosum]|uniref:Uncharacterized protein n=1 Tax=Rhizoclosmatium globosum TaxID=329046 RepID=A0A1Y2BSE6_9FUNG|nr:hypothetical protein BCR33DRAFT_769744 [Rhizoclosmatium globosum]|eukprot:ORY37670.1 hypothetical protein BCR33DRAFT_769744 [Rhizoclosmatium globosum]